MKKRVYSMRGGRRKPHPDSAFGSGTPVLYFTVISSLVFEWAKPRQVAEEGGGEKMSIVRKLLQVSLLVMMGCLFASAQKITPPNGYYPPAYNGDAWIGRVEKVDERTQSLTLVSVDKNRKKETFVGVLEKGYLARHKSGRIEPLKVSEIPTGLKVTVFYEPRTKKVGGKKIHYNVIINMHPILNRRKGYFVFRAF